ncbi:Ltp family lipoprotein [uncultured Microbacterium sp.]|uniref:Ltp family lipoprotein n=1 Tax=uncultured Microbacterium sp. TaxID=191216 RepID=UPI002605A58A|nr:Ltp family lipoprotein [uncultured Microbacterium sp.]
MSDNITPASPLPPAGWYPDPQNASTQRYWDGARWTEQVNAGSGHPASTAPHGSAHPSTLASAAVLPTGAVAVAPKTGLRALRWWQWALIALGALLLIAAIGGAIGGAKSTDDLADADAPVAAVSTPTAEPVEEEPDTTVAVPDVGGGTIGEARTLVEAAGFTLTTDAGAGDDWIITSQSPTGGLKAEPGTAVSVTAEAPKPVYSLEQQNALEEAQSYLDYSGFSRQGLIDQLSSEYGGGYPVDVATWAVDTVGADWNAEAVESAQDYLDYSSISRQGLYDQLTSAYGGQFTPDEANHALAAVGY